MASASVLNSFEPVIDKSSELLVLGTLPGPESLRVGQYYANPNNQFWRIIYSALDETEVSPTYPGKLSFLLGRGIALWDIFHSAERAGALDADIRNELPNDIPGLLTLFPRICRILLNGRKAASSFHRYFPDTGIDAVYVPSSSPAYAKKSLAEKTEEWRAAIMTNRQPGGSQPQ